MGGWWRGRRRKAREQDVIDLRERVPGLPSRPAAVPAAVAAERSEQLYAALVERRRAEVARAEAQRELEELRRRHWSPDRIFEESRLGIDWWEHPLADPHAVLGLLPGDTFADANAARRNIAKAVHPDVAGVSDGAGGDDREQRAATATQQMAAVNAAHDRMRRALGPLPEPRTVDGVDEPSGALEQRAVSRWSASLTHLPPPAAR